MKLTLPTFYVTQVAHHPRCCSITFYNVAAFGKCYEAVAEYRSDRAAQMQLLFVAQREYVS